MLNSTKICTLRELMRKNGVDAVIVPSCDPHMSEYPPERYKTRRFISGFTGTAGTAVVTRDMWGVWTDGRYYIQCASQISEAGGVLFRSLDADCPTVGAFLAEHLAPGATVAINGEVCSESTARELRSYFGNEITLRHDLSLAEDIWQDRPMLEPKPMWAIPDDISGMTVREKLSAVREKLMCSGADALLSARLDSNAWLFNVRAEDIPFVPAPTSWALITSTDASIFTQPFRVSGDVMRMLNENGVAVREYGDVEDAVRELSGVKLLIESAEINMSLWSAAVNNGKISVVEGKNPIPALKTVKTRQEIESTRKAYIEDCKALAEFHAELDTRVAAGEKLTEYDAAVLLEEKRRLSPNYIGDSFAPIVAYGANAAMMHYGPAKETAKTLGRSHFLLVDTGGHYRYGTTDITRTYALGELTEDEKLDYTTCVKSFINLHRAVFPRKTPGRELDNLSRVHVWRRGLDYRCGTGHGLGFLLNIHEGPVGFGPVARDFPIDEGMMISDEPGIYREGVSGVRTENALFAVPYVASEYGDYLAFDTFTYLPIDPAPLIPSEMDESEVRWLNEYNKSVREKLLPLLSEAARIWLERTTVALEK